MSADTLLREATALLQAGRYAEVRKLCVQVLAAQPDHPEASHLSGLAEYREGRYADALEWLRRAIAGAPANAVYQGNLGNILKDAGRRDEAVTAYRRAIELDPRHAPARNNLGVLLLERDEVDAAAMQFRDVIARRPDHFRAHFNLGNALHRQGDAEGALAAWRHSLALQPDFADALGQVGLALLSHGRFEEALSALRRRATLEPDSAVAHADLALALHRHGDLAEAAVSYERAVSLAPDAIEVVCNFCALLQKICDWDRLAVHIARVVRAVEEGRSGVPLGLLVLLPEFTAAMQLAAARAHAATLSGQPVLAPSRIDAQRERLRIGYLSADFREHATAWLTAELFELHDRECFEIVLFSYGPDDGGSSRQRLRRAADRFVDLEAMSDVPAARRIADEGIDILVDLNGNTDNGRMGIAALRPALLQVNWLGFPGTLGAEFYDYLIADAFIIPPGAEQHYSEAVVRLPDCYQSNDRQRPRPAAAPDRRACGLPADGPVLCCFNQSIKITAPIFALWMRVLAAAPDAVLWLLEDNHVASTALRRRASASAIAPHRLVFAPRCPHGEHLARYLTADLAVDTFPYVSHTTASDALWLGCPLVTLTGETFASRVAGSVLANAGLPECVATSMPEYEALVTALARRPERLSALRARLDAARLTAPLFDTPRFARSLEAAYRQMAALAVRGERPQGFDVPRHES